MTLQVAEVSLFERKSWSGLPFSFARQKSRLYMSTISQQPPGQTAGVGAEPSSNPQHPKGLLCPLSLVSGTCESL